MRVSSASLVAAAVVVACAFAAAAPAAAQTTVAAKIGVNSSNVDIVPEFEPIEGFGTIETDRRGGLVLGGLVGVPIAGGFGLQIEGLYSQKGSNITFYGTPVGLRLHYLEFPVLAGYAVGPADGVRVRFLAGPTFGALLKDVQSLEDRDLEGDDRVKFKSGDVGIAFGAAIEARRFILDLRYTHGLSDWNDDIGQGIEEIRNRTFTVTVGWRMR
jgi:Outer membrane protein beta-barrel domain